jgi:prophage antirepressor-like protein
MEEKQYELQIFEYEEERQFRTLDIDGEPWFVLSDVCRELEIGNTSDAARRLDDDEKGVATIDTLGGSQRTTIINESGLYNLILNSRKPAAKKFKKWVTSEVLPSIRKMGGYVGSAKAVPADWKPFIDRLDMNWGAVPEGYFSVFKELADLMATLVTNGVEMNHKFIPDISVGLLWGRFWDERMMADDYGQRVQYLHNYPDYFPQARSNPQLAWAYPEEALVEFRRWARSVYLKEGLPKYLTSKQKDGTLPVGFKEAVLGAVGAPEPRKALKPPSF